MSGVICHKLHSPNRPSHAFLGFLGIEGLERTTRSEALASTTRCHDSFGGSSQCEAPKSGASSAKALLLLCQGHLHESDGRQVAMEGDDDLTAAACTGLGEAIVQGKELALEALLKDAPGILNLRHALAQHLAVEDVHTLGS